MFILIESYSSWPPLIIFKTQHLSLFLIVDISEVINSNGLFLTFTGTCSYVYWAVQLKTKGIKVPQSILINEDVSNFRKRFVMSLLRPSFSESLRIY